MSSNENTRFFRHYKNKPYRYLGVVRHSETLEEMALYETLYENKLGRMWVRPKEMFFENVVIAGIEQPRFKSIAFTFKSFFELDSKLLAEIKEVHQLSFKSEINESKFLSKIDAHKKILVLAAYEDQKLVGFKLGYMLDQDRFYSWTGAVHPDYQGLGIASKLMRIQHDWCKSQGFKFVETRSRNQYKQMLTLNLKNGFEIVGTLKDSKGIKILFEKSLNI